MKQSYLIAPLGDCMIPIERPEITVAGKIYRQIGVRLWGEGAYERESIDGSQTQYKTLSCIKASDIIVNKIWARNGSVAVVPESLAGCYGSGEFPTFTPIQEKLNPRWFHWFTKTKNFWEQCDEKSHGTSGKNRIRPEKFLEILIPLPSLTDQCRIVERIEELAASIEEARGLRREAVEEANKLLSLASARAYDEAANMAERVERLDELCLTITDGTHVTPTYVSEGVPFLSVKDITTGTIRFDDTKFISPEEHSILSRRCRPESGDVLLTKVGTTGFAKAIDTDREFSIFVSLALLKIDRQRLLPKFTEYMLNSSRLKEYSASGTRGVGNKNLVLKFIREFPMPAPPLLEQHRIVSSLEDLESKLESLGHLQSEASAELDALLPSILDKAFKGEL